MFNFDDLQKVESVNTRKGQPRVSYDLRFNNKTKVFSLGKAFFDKYRMDRNGFYQHNDKEGKIAALSVQAEEHSRFYKGKGEGGKTMTFKNETLTKSLMDAGFINENDKAVEFTLKHEGEHSGVDYFSFQKHEKATGEDAEGEAKEESENSDEFRF